MTLGRINPGRDTARLAAQRAAYIASVWAGAGGVLPASQPDTITPNWGGHGLAWVSRVDRLISTTYYGFTDELRLFHPPVAPATSAPILIYLGGHDGNLSDQSNPNMVNIKYFVDAGLRVLGGSMPLLDPNPTSVLVTIGAESTTLSATGVGSTNHDAFTWITDRSGVLLPIFLDGKFRAINYLQATYPAAPIHICGISGGGWGTSMVAALDGRVQNSYDVAGSLPFAMRVGADVGDYEQRSHLSYYRGTDTTFEDVYLWRTIGGRRAVNVYNLYDAVAFSANGREASFRGIADTIGDRIGPGGVGEFEVIIDETYNTPPGQHAMSPDIKDQIIEEVSA